MSIGIGVPDAWHPSGGLGLIRIGDCGDDLRTGARREQHLRGPRSQADNAPGGPLQEQVGAAVIHHVRYRPRMPAATPPAAESNIPV